jgi:hypothetical protein
VQRQHNALQEGNIQFALYADFCAAQVFGSQKPQNTPSEPKQGDPAGKLVLLSFQRTGASLVSASQFGGKVEMALRMAGLDFEGRIGKLLDRKHAPKRKARALANRQLAIRPMRMRCRPCHVCVAICSTAHSVARSSAGAIQTCQLARGCAQFVVWPIC